jgi:hypothetical protein
MTLRAQDALGIHEASVPHHVCCYYCTAPIFLNSPKMQVPVRCLPEPKPLSHKWACPPCYSKNHVENLYAAS